MRAALRAAAGPSLLAMAVVIDSGEASIKFGLAGDEFIKAAVPSLVVRPRGRPGDLILGVDAASAALGSGAIESPINRGLVKSWDDLERLWQHAFVQCGVQPRSSPLLLADEPLSSLRSRRQAAEIVFEKLGCPALHFVRQPVLALYAIGSMTGVVLDCGEGVTHASAVVDGFAAVGATVRSEIGGRDVTAQLLRRLQRAGHSLSPASARSTLQTLKETHCRVAATAKDLEEEQRAAHASMPAVCRLPDGGAIQLGPERTCAPEVLFSPAATGRECKAVHDTVLLAVGASDMNTRRALLANVNIVGGSSLLPGFCERTLHELRRGTPQDVRICLQAPPTRQYSSWVGGSIFASLATFDAVAVKKAEYQEKGAAIFDGGLW